MALAEEREVKPNGESICSSINCGQLSIWPTHGKFVLALESGQDMADGVFRSVAAMDGEKARRTGLFGWAAGDAKSGFGRPLATLLISPSHQESLAEVREVEIRVEGRAAPDAACLDPARLRSV